MNIQNPSEYNDYQKTILKFLDDVHSIHWNFCEIVESVKFNKSVSFSKIDDINKVVKILKDNGVRVTAEPTIGLIFELTLVATILISIKGFVNENFNSKYFGRNAKAIKNAYLENIKELHLVLESIKQINFQWLVELGNKIIKNQNEQ